MKIITAEKNFLRYIVNKTTVSKAVLSADRGESEDSMNKMDVINYKQYKWLSEKICR